MTESIYDIYGWNSSEVKRFQARFHQSCLKHKEQYTTTLTTAGLYPICDSCDNEMYEEIEDNMKVKEYEEFCCTHSNMSVEDVNYSFVGLAGEVGECMEWYKKAVLRKGTTFKGEDLIYELGDVIHYLTRIGKFYGWTLKDIMAANVEKLTERRKHDTIVSGPEIL